MISNIGELLVAVAVWTAAAAVLVLALVLLVPELWRSARDWL